MAATKKKTQRVGKTLRQAVKDHVQAGHVTLYAVAQGSGLTYPVITRFVSGDGPLGRPVVYVCRIGAGLTTLVQQPDFLLARRDWASTLELA